MKYGETKSHLIDEICELCTNLDTSTLADIMNLVQKKQPIDINEYIKSEFIEYPKEVRDELEHEVRKIWLATGPGCQPCGYLLKNKEDIKDWTDIEIEGYMLDTWIGEQDTLFNPITLAIIIFEIYCGRICFSHK